MELENFARFDFVDEKQLIFAKYIEEKREDFHSGKRARDQIKKELANFIKQ